MNPVNSPSLSRSAWPVPDGRFCILRNAETWGIGRTLPCILFVLLAGAVLGGCTGLTTGVPRPGRDDAAIAAQVRSLIAQDPELRGSQIRVFVLEGNVTLSGTVPDAGPKVRLLNAVKDIGGVRSVADNLEVRKAPDQ